jgi:NADH dehydrogenase
VVNLVAILHGSVAAFSHVHQELPAKIARACRAQAVRHVVHVSALGVNTDQPQALPSHYLRSKALGELALMDGLGLRGADANPAAASLTVLRPSVVFGANDKFLNVFAALQAHVPLMPLACADALFQPVWVEDVAQAVVYCVGRGLDGVAPLQVFELAGPQVLSLRQLVQFAARCAGIRQGRGRPVLGLPLWMGRVQAALLGLLPGAPLMSADNLASMQLPNVLDGRLPGLAALGITATALETIGPQYLVADPARAGFDGLRQRHR